MSKQYFFIGHTDILVYVMNIELLLSQRIILTNLMIKLSVTDGSNLTVETFRLKIIILSSRGIFILFCTLL